MAAFKINNRLASKSDFDTVATCLLENGASRKILKNNNHLTQSVIFKVLDTNGNKRIDNADLYKLTGSVSSFMNARDILTRYGIKTDHTPDTPPPSRKTVTKELKTAIEAMLLNSQDYDNPKLDSKDFYHVHLVKQNDDGRYGFLIHTKEYMNVPSTIKRNFVFWFGDRAPFAVTPENGKTVYPNEFGAKSIGDETENDTLYFFTSHDEAKAKASERTPHTSVMSLKLKDVQLWVCVPSHLQ